MRRLQKMSRYEALFEKAVGPLRKINRRLAVGRCPSCGTDDSLFIDLKTGSWRCGRLPDSLLKEGERGESSERQTT